MNRESSSVPAILISITGLILLAVITLLIILNTGDTSDTCKETSTTTAEYRVCIAFEQCRNEFKDNSQLSGSCIADIIIGR